MYSYKLISHPDVLLIQHLKNVGNRCENIINSKNINFKYTKKDLTYIAKVMGYTHDLGKGTIFFQTYIKDMIEKDKSDVDKNLRCHGYLSALYTYEQLKDFNEKLALMCFVIVRKHHGDLENADFEYSFSNQEIKNQKKIFKKQIDGIYDEEIKNILLELKLKDINKDELIANIDSIEEEADNLTDELQSNSNCEEYILYKFLYSTLIFADKEDAIFHDNNKILYDIPYNIIDTYKMTAFKGEFKNIDLIRNSIYDSVISSTNESNNRIMSITVPTGTGKTLTAMSAALHLKQKLKEEMKIIYCLPFTSVIDQNYDVYSNIVDKTMGKEKVTSDRILKHHHLSEPKYVSENRNYEANQSKFLVENWNSQIIVTTFMQFFNCLFSNKNNQVVKFNSISNSIVLLDEIQSVPYKYWYIINNFFKEIAELLNVYFVLITATQPLIFNKKEIVQLVNDNEKYFKSFKRTKLHIDIEPKTCAEFTQWLEELIIDNENKNILIIVNTLKLAQLIYHFIKDMEIENTEEYFLSTGIVPKERKIRIDNIKYSKKRKIAVSTQLIEAGVDIDMDIVVRDMATLDSVNQSAGRCNREYREEYLGEVYLCNIVNEKNVPYSSFIYDKYLIDKTRKVLMGKVTVLEEDFLKLNDDYFNAVSKDMSNDESRKLINYIKLLKFKDVNDNFRLIENQDKVSVFIETDEKAVLTWNRYEDIMKEKNLIFRREKFATIKKEFYDNVISVYKNKINKEEEYFIVHISNEELKGMYDNEIGYILEDKDQYI